MIEDNLLFSGHVTVQGVSRRPLTSEARAQSHTSPCEICGGRSDTEVGLSSSNSVSPVTLIPAMLRNNLQKAEARIRSKKKKLFRKIVGQTLLSVLVVFKRSIDVRFQLGLDTGFNWNAVSRLLLITSGDMACI
jgi:hypothetical protein